MSEGSIKLPGRSNDSFSPGMYFSGTKILVKCHGSCLKQQQITFKHKNTPNLYIVYEINLWSYDQGTY